MVSIDQQRAEERYDLEPADPSLSPDRLYERRWALLVLEQTLRNLEEEMRAGNQLELFGALKGSLALDDRATTHADLARRLGMGESAVKVALHRLRKRYRALLLETIRQTVSTAEEVEEEVHELFRILGN